MEGTASRGGIRQGQQGGDSKQNGRRKKGWRAVKVARKMEQSVCFEIVESDKSLGLRAKRALQKDN